MRYFVAVAETLAFRPRGGSAYDGPAVPESPNRAVGRRTWRDALRAHESARRTHRSRTPFSDRCPQNARVGRCEYASRARECRRHTRGNCASAFLAGAMLTRLPSILRAYGERFSQRHSHTPRDVESRACSSAARGYDRCRVGQLNVPDPDIVSQGAASDPMLAVLPTGHRLEKKRKIALKELTGERLILMSRALAPLLYEQTLAQCMANGYTPLEVVEVQDDMVATLGLVAAGMGVGVAPFPWSAIHMQGLVFRDLTTRFYGEQTLSWQSRSRHADDSSVHCDRDGSALEVMITPTGLAPPGVQDGSPSSNDIR